MSSFITQTYDVGPLSALRLETSQETNIFRDMIYVSDRNKLKEFEYLVNFVIPSLLKKNFLVSSSLEKRVEKVEVHFPTFCVTVPNEKAQSTRLMTPFIARMTDQSYMCKIVCTIAHYNPINETFISRETKAIDSIPCMVGSCRCPTAYKPDEIDSLDEWKMTLGEDPTIPGGSFIKNGAKKVFLYGEKLGTDTFIIVETKGTNPRVETRIIELFESKTYLMRLQAGKHRAGIKVLYPFLKGKHYPLFLVIYLLSSKTLSENKKPFNWSVYIDKIASYAPVEEQEYIRAYIKTSEQIFINKFTVIVDGEYQVKTSLITEYIVKKSRKQNLSKEVMNFVTATNKVFNECFVSRKTACEKIANFCFMASLHIRCCLKLREFSSRDAWPLKKLDSDCVLIERDIAEHVVDKIINGGSDDGAWRIGKRDKSENVIESLKVDSIALIRSLFSKINAIVDEKTKAFSLRAVSQSGYGVICPAKTAEGGKCGINKHRTICCRTSNNSEHIPNRMAIIFEIAYSYATYSSTERNIKCNRLLSFVINGTRRTAKVDTTGITTTSIITELLDEERDIDELLDIDDSPDIYVSEDFIEILSNDEQFMSLIESSDVLVEIDDEEIIIHFNSEEPQLIQMWNGGTIALKCDDVLLEVFKRAFSVVNEYFSTMRDSTYRYLFTYNGNVLLSGTDEIFQKRLIGVQYWTNPDIIVPFLKLQRRENVLPDDCCIFRNNQDQAVQYFDDSGRLLSPYLIVDDDGELLLDKFMMEDGSELLKDFLWKGNDVIDYNGSNDRIEALYKYGIIEPVDAKELETTFMAEDINECRTFSKLRKFLNSLDINSSDTYFGLITGTKTFRNGDVGYITYTNGKKYDIDFVPDYRPYTENAPISLSTIVDDTEVELFGMVAFTYNSFKQTTEHVVKLTKSKKTAIRDGYHFCYIDDDQNAKWVPKGHVGLSDTEYNGKRIIGVRMTNDVVYKILKQSQDGRYYFVNCNFKHFVKDELDDQPFYFDEAGKPVYVQNQFESDNIYDVIHFNGQSEGFFESKVETMYKPLIEEYNYENFDYEREKTYYDALVKENKNECRECDLLIAEIRANLKPFDTIQDYENVTHVMDILRTHFPMFKKKSNIYKLQRYLNWRFKFTHVPIDPNVTYSSTANLCVKSNHNQGPRFTYQCAMGTQALGIGNIMWSSQFETSIKRAIAPKQHLYETVAEEPLGAVTMPTRENYVVGVMTHRRSPEDALVIAKSVYQMTARYEKEVTIEVRMKKEENSIQTVSFPTKYDGNRKTEEKFRHLDEDGMPMIGSMIQTGDCIVGLEKMDTKTGHRHDVSKFALIGEEGEVVRIRKFSTEGSKKETIVLINIVQRRFQQIGDKFAAPFSQKGTIGHVTDEADTQAEALLFPKYEEEKDGVQSMFYSFMSDPTFVEKLNNGELKYKVVDDNKMPIVRGGPNDGLAIQILFSPFSFPSRMTIGMDFELIISKACLYIQKKADGTTFHDPNLDYYTQILVDNGLDRDGCEFISHSDGEIMIDSTTGNQMKAFIGICSYQVLKHHVYDKRSYRGKGDRDPICKQPVAGRPNRGGQRCGEMETDTFKAHGAAQILLERLMYASDVYDAIFCEACGNRSNKSDVTIGVCSLCKTSGSLIVNEQPMVFSVFCNNMAGMCLNTTLKFPKKKKATKATANDF